MSEKPKAALAPSERERKKQRLVGFVTLLVLFALALAVFFLHSEKESLDEANYQNARDVIADFAAGNREVCSEKIDKSLEAMRKQLARAKVRAGLINHQAIVYHQVLENMKRVCSEGVIDAARLVTAKEQCGDAKTCFNGAMVMLLSGDLDRAEAHCKEGIVFDNSAALRVLYSLVRDISPPVEK